MANPKLAMIPTGYKAGKVYSVLPESGVGDFTFDRDSLATRVNENGLIETMAIDVPRLDYTDGGCPSLLLEPESTNAVPYSEDFSDVVWTKTGLSSVASGFTSPDGTNNAYKLIEDTLNSVHRIVDDIIVSGTGVVYTQSVFAKSGSSGRYLRMFRGSGTYNNAVFDLENGTVITQAGSNIISTKIEEYANGWYRCSSTYTTQFGNVGTYYGLQNGNTDSYQGDGTSHIYLWGAMLEELSYPTSYIPTNGTAVTRVGETCNDSGDASTFNDSEGVLMFEGSFLSKTSSQNRRIAISDGTTSNTILIQNVGSVSNRLQFYTIVNNATSTDFYTDLSDITLFNKIVFKYKINNFSVWINGFEVLTDTSGITFPNGTLTELAFDGGDGGNDFYGNTKQIQYFDSTLTDAELETLTSWQSFLEMANAQNYTII